MDPWLPPSQDEKTEQNWTVPPPSPPEPSASGAASDPPSRTHSLRMVFAAAGVSAITAAGATLGVLSYADVPIGKQTPAASTAGRSVAVSNDSTNMDALLAKVEPGVVAISTTGFASFGPYGVRQQQGAGTGMIIESSGIVITNAHVVSGAQRISIKIPNDATTHSAKVLGSDKSNDIAVLQIENGKDFPTVSLGASGAVKVGDPVVAIGNALALPGGPTVTTGIVSALNRSLDTDTNSELSDVMQTDAAINPGNSGGPLINGAGEVIGMNTAVSSDAQNIGFAIPIDSIKPLVEKLKTGEGTTTTTSNPRQSLIDRFFS